jgi:hypothetical protein
MIFHVTLEQAEDGWIPLCRTVKELHRSWWPSSAWGD